MASPIQVVLNPENYQEARETAGGGGRKDFFADRDNEFRIHRSSLISQIETISEVLSAQRQGDVGFAKVILRREAWAKSHRPVATLFRPDRTPVVGGGDLGVMLVEVRPSSLAQVSAEVAKAETNTRMKFNEFKQKEIPHPSGQKSEAGAIDRIEMYGPSDRRGFSVDEAVAWLANPMTGSSYLVELFDSPPARSEWDRLDAGRRQLLESFIAGFAAFGQGLAVERLPSGRNRQPVLSVRLDQSTDQILRLSDTSQVDRRRSVARFNPDVDRHARLLSFLDHHPLVRRIELPGIVVRSDAPAAPSARTRPTGLAVPIRDSRRTHPRIGIIDGGISDALSDWVIDRWDVLAEEDTDHAHGTFIGGLAAVGGAINGVETCPEPDGAELVDVAVFPDEAKAGAFASYYPEGLPQFFDEMANAVSDARARHGVRVFNMSLNVLQPTTPDRYSQHAARLDQIAEANNAIIFISAGNIGKQDERAEWPTDTSAALANLVNTRNDALLTPAESSRNVAVASLNPPGHAGCVAFAPSRFSRRGPGMRAGVKPDLAHVGGSGSRHAELGHGLFSLLPDGTIIDGCGTSYAAPLAAKTAAVLDHAIEGEVSRETLIGLLVHHAELPASLQSKELAPVARHLVGFGMPPPADRILDSGDHAITLVFASRIQRGQQINFRFAWPPSLVEPGGRCRGRAKVTLVSTPPLDPRFGSEFVRVNINATLQQEKKDGKWGRQLDPLHLPMKGDAHAIEAERIEHGLKWSPVKVHAKTFKRGVGASSNWRLFIDYLTRAGEVMPAEGIPFTVIVTISDPKDEQPVFNDMRQNLQALGTQIADIRTAARITPRI